MSPHASSAASAFANLQRTLLDFRADLVRLRESRGRRNARLQGLLEGKLDTQGGSPREESEEAQTPEEAPSQQPDSSDEAQTPEEAPLQQFDSSEEAPPTLRPGSPACGEPPRSPTQGSEGAWTCITSPEQAEGGSAGSEAGSSEKTDPEMPQLTPASPRFEGFLMDEDMATRRLGLPLGELKLGKRAWDSDDSEDVEAAAEDDDGPELLKSTPDLGSCWRRGALAAALKGLGGC